jgi:hypothetical protein
VISTAWGLADCLVEVLPKSNETKLINVSGCVCQPTHTNCVHLLNICYIVPSFTAVPSYST